MKHPIKIIIADDQKLFRKGLTYILGNFGNIQLVGEASSGEELLEKLHTVKTDVVLMDLNMPDLDGISTSELVLKKYPEIRIIILSMYNDDAFILHMMEMGASGYLPKDVDPLELKKAIEKVVKNGVYYSDLISKIILRGFKSRKRGRLSLNSSQLTKREIEVLDLICQGLTTSEIAEKLFISIRTVEGHRKNLIEKTGTRNSVSLAVYAIQHKLVDCVL